MPHPKTDYEFCFRRVVKFLGAAAPLSAEGATVNTNSPYTLDQIRKGICQADVEIIGLIVSQEDHPFRNEYFTEKPSPVSDGGRVPAFIGQHGGVQVENQQTWVSITNGSPSVATEPETADQKHIGSTMIVHDPVSGVTRVQGRIINAENGDLFTLDTNASATVSNQRGTVYSTGRLAQSYAHLEKVKQNFAFYNAPEDLYFIENGVVHTASGKRALVFAPTIPVPNDEAETPALASPKVYALAVVAHTLMNLRPVGADTAHRNDWAGIFSAYAQMILSGTGSLPEPERLQRISS